MHAVWNAVLKRAEDKKAAMVGISGFTGLLFLPLVPLAPLPPPDLWPWLLASFSIHLIYQLALTKALEMGALTFIYPIARGMGPTLVAIFSYLFLEGEMSLIEVGAVIILAIGIFISTSTGKATTGGTARENGFFFALLTGAMIASYTIVDGLAVRVAPEPLTYIIWSSLAFAPIFLTYSALHQGPQILKAAGKGWRTSMTAGIIAQGGYAIALYAYSIGSLGEVAAIRETSILFALLIGAWWLKEPISRRRWLAVPLISFGAVLLKLV